MKFLTGQNYVEVKDKRYGIHPTENISLRLRDGPKSLRTQYKLQNITQIRKNQKVIKNGNDGLLVYPKNKQPIIKQQSKFKPPKCPSCQSNNCLDLIKVTIFKIVNILPTNKDIR